MYYNMGVSKDELLFTHIRLQYESGTVNEYQLNTVTTEPFQAVLTPPTEEVFSFIRRTL